MNMEVFKRHELKFLLNQEERAAVERVLYRELTRDTVMKDEVCSVYYDTPDFRMIRNSSMGFPYKEKLRIRSYGPVAADAPVYLEMKKKYEGIVYKRRIHIPLCDATAFLNGNAELPIQEGYMGTQISRELEHYRSFYGTLVPAMYLSYYRQAWYGEWYGSPVRITMDRNISRRRTDMSLTAPMHGELLIDPGYSLMEVKVEHAVPLWLTELLTAKEIRQQSFSKYGLAYRTDIMRKRGIYCA